MGEDQNSNGKDQAKEVIPVPAKESPETNIEETPIPAPAEAKEKPTAPSLPTSNTEPQTETMEVHKHPHHVMHKKKWSEYVLEFLMIFLAVFLGFVAENVREHVVEKNRAKEYAETLVNDLRLDSAEFSSAIARKKLCVDGIDTLIRLLRRSDYQVQIKEITRLFSYIRNNYYVTRHDATEQQLVSSGSLRFYDAGLYNDITNYYSDVKTYNETNNLYYLRVPIIDQLSGLFDYREAADSSQLQHDVTDATQWMPNHGMELNRFITYSIVVQNIYTGQIKILSGMKNKAVRLSGLIERKYHLAAG